MEKFSKSEDAVADQEVVSESKIEVIKTPESVESINLKEEAEENAEKERHAIDAQRIEEIRESINGKKGWNASLKPQSEWDEEYRTRTTQYKNEADYYREKYSANPLNFLKRWVKSFSKDARDKKAVSEKIKVDFAEQQKKFPYEKHLIYQPEAGVVGAVYENSIINAPGFLNCSGLVFQTEGKVAVIHMSPETVKQEDILVGDIDVLGHIRSVIKQLIGGSENGKTKAGSVLSEEEIKTAQALIDSGALKSTMIVGDPIMTWLVDYMSRDGKAHNLPNMKVGSHFVGPEKSTVYATPEKIFVEKSGVILEDGVNMPPPMFDFEEV